jgi:hypothetical protein
MVHPDAMAMVASNVVRKNSSKNAPKIANNVNNIAEN